MTKNPYFQFPLCALSFGKTLDARLNGIINYCIVETGGKLFRKLTAEKQRDFLEQCRDYGSIPSGFKKDNWSHGAAIYGATIVGITFGHFPSCFEQHRLLHDHIVAFEKVHGRDAQVRIKKRWVFDARDGHGLTYREFSVLCAIYSAIGNKKLAIITRDRIRRCALGYRKTAIMQAELSTRADKTQPLTDRQLRDTIERLHRNKFFARCTVARRITYYSIRLDSEALRKKVLERRTYPEFFRASQTAQDEALTATIKAKRTSCTSP